MSSNPSLTESSGATPDYELAETAQLTRPDQVQAISNPLRTAILGLLHERAATVTELAQAVGRPKSTVAHHVKVLTDAGLLTVVRTRRVRAIEERFYGRTARLFYVGVGGDGDPAGAGAADLPPDFNDFEVAARESAPAHRERRLWGFLRHARLSADQVDAFWHRMAELVLEFDQLPRSGDTVYGFAVGIYPTDHPMLPPAADLAGTAAISGESAEGQLAGGQSTDDAKDHDAAEESSGDR